MKRAEIVAPLTIFVRCYDFCVYVCNTNIFHVHIYIMCVCVWSVLAGNWGELSATTSSESLRVWWDSGWHLKLVLNAYEGLSIYSNYFMEATWRHIVGSRHDTFTRGLFSFFVFVWQHEYNEIVLHACF